MAHFAAASCRFFDLRSKHRVGVACTKEVAPVDVAHFARVRHETEALDGFQDFGLLNLGNHVGLAFAFDDVTAWLLWRSHRTDSDVTKRSNTLTMASA